MHDIRLIRENPAAFDAALARRGAAPASDRLVALDERRRTTIAEAQAAQTRRNELSKAIGQAKAQKDEPRAQALMAEVAALKAALPTLEADEAALTAELDNALAAIPNLPAPEVPEGTDETGNVLISIPTFATANPVGSVAAHVSQHVAAVTHAYESRIFNPPETKS